MLIFILDDDEMMCETIGILLEENGFVNYKIFTKPEDLLIEISLEVRICIIDYNLNNKMNGQDVIDKIKEKNPACYFIMVTGLRSYDVIERFCNTVNRGKFLQKADLDFPQKFLGFLSEILEDIKIMDMFYTQKEELQKSLQYVKTLLKRNDTDE